MDSLRVRHRHLHVIQDFSRSGIHVTSMLLLSLGAVFDDPDAGTMTLVAYDLSDEAELVS